MKTKTGLIIFYFLLTFITNAHAVLDLPDLPPNNLIDLRSAPGTELLRKNATENTMKLLSNFATQELPAYCGVATSVTVLNAIGKSLPLNNEHPIYPKDVNNPYHLYFSQKNFFNDDVKKVVLPSEAAAKGITLTQLFTILKGYQRDRFSNVAVYYTNELSADAFRNILKKSISEGHFIAVNFLRAGLNQGIGAHYSPLAAYDESTDRFLMLDVARYKYPPFWVKTEDLYKATNTVDADARRSRGFIDITP